MEKLPASAGWSWIRQGFGIFRQQFGEISALYALFFFLTMVLTLIPRIGPILRMISMPAFSMAFMWACADVQRGKRVHPRILFAGFRKPVIKSLLILGAVYLAAVIPAFLVANAASGGAFWQALNSTAAPDEKTWEDLGLVWPMLDAMIVYLSITVLLWFAAPLIAWQNMSVGKAIFFSFFAVIRAFKAFFVYLCAWASIIMILLSIVGSILNLLVGDAQPVMLVPFAILLMAVAQCSVYPSYVQIFGVPQLPE